MKKKITSLFLILFISCTGIYADKKTILFFPFMNEGSYRLDRLKTHIPNYLYEPVKDLPGYNTVSYSTLRAYMAEEEIVDEDFKRYQVIESTGLHFDADYIIHGYYLEKDDELTVSFTIYRRSGREYVPRHALVTIHLKNLSAPTLNASLDDLLRINEEVTGRPLDRGHLTVVTNPSCRLFIDGEQKGETPLRLALRPGDHRVMLFYNGFNGEEMIYNETIHIEKDHSWEKKIDVFVPLKINAEQKCTVYIDGEERGPTPFHENLYWGRKYNVKSVYYGDDGGEMTVYEVIIDTQEKVPPVYISAKASVTLDFPDRFSAVLGEETSDTLPFTFQKIIPGNYRLTMFLDDPEWKRQWVYTDTVISLSPFDKVVFDRESIPFHKNWSLLLLPSAMQFHNKQPVKGTVVITSFLVSAAATGVFAVFWLYNEGEYNHMIENIGDYSSKEIEKMRIDRNGFFELFIGGIAVSASVWLYSAIDGIVIQNHLSELVYGE
jgi:hypothetical protein